MFRNLKLALCLSLCLSLFTACGPAKEGENKASKGTETSTSAPTPSATISTADDGKLQGDVEAKLKAEATLKDAKITVKVSGGQVTLSGTVKKAEEKDKAEEIANGVIGSSKAGLVNDLQISE